MDGMKRIIIVAIAVIAAGCSQIGQPLWTPAAPTTPLTPGDVKGTPAPTVPLTPTGLKGTDVPLLRARVCTKYERGALNLRTCPGTECWVVFVLREGEEVRVRSESVEVDGTPWVMVTHPRRGWVNARYLCAGD